jgi:hypothetical protein
MANDAAELAEALEYEPNDDAKKMCSEYIAELRKRELSSSENLDKSILAYSSAGLALSLGFLKDFISVKLASFPYLLYSSWALFAAATIITTVSFLVSYFAQVNMQARAERYYMQGDANAFTERNWFNSALTIFNIASTSAFVLAIVFTTFFVAVNLEKANQMSNRKVVYDGVQAPLMQKVQGSTDFNKGLPTPTLQQMPAAVSRPAPATNQTTTPSSPPASKKQ